MKPLNEGSLFKNYEERLNEDPMFALNQGSKHFEESSDVFRTLHNFADRLKALKISYAVVGDMALFRHCLRRFTERCEILVTDENLQRIHDELEGNRYLPQPLNSMNLRDTEVGVRIEFFITGGFPGDGKQKPVSFPDPKDVSFEADGISYVKLPTLIELKLASGMTSPGRLKDLADVQELIKVLNLVREFGEQLDSSVRGKFAELRSVIDESQSYEMIEGQHHQQNAKKEN